LLAITAELHVFDGATNWAQPLRLGVSIAGRDFIRICERRGDSIHFDSQPLEEANLGEGGRVEIYDITARVSPALRNREIGAPRVIHDGGGRPIGLALPFVRGGAFCLWVNDDEFYWGDEAALRSAAFTEGVRPVIGRRL